MGEPVKVHIYDLSKGMARSMSQAFLGKQIDGIWHTGIVVYGQEFFFGGLGGIESCNPGGLQMLGPPDEIVEVGKTEIPFEVFMDHLRELGTTTFRGDRYHLLDHNCNSFSNELALFLTGNPIPSKITSLPHEVMSTPFGAMIRPMLDSMQVTPGGHQMFPETTSSATNFPNTTMTSTNAAGSGTLAQNQYFPKTSYYTFDTANIKAILGKLKEFGGKVPPELQVREVLIDQLEGMAEGKEHRLEQLNTLQKLLQWPTGHANSASSQTESSSVAKLPHATFWDETVMADDKVLKLTGNDQQLCEEIYEYLKTEDCSWSPGRPHLQLIGRLLEDASGKCQTATSLLQNMTTKEDIVMLLVNDVTCHGVIYQCLSKLHSYTENVQEHILKTFCNLTQQKSFLAYLQENKIVHASTANKVSLSQLCDVCTECLFTDESIVVNSVACALCYNILQTELHEDVLSSLGMALVQLSTKDVQKIYCKYCIHSLYQCMKKNNEVTSLAVVMDMNINHLVKDNAELETVQKEIKMLMHNVKP